MTLTQNAPSYVALELEVTDVLQLSPSFVRVAFGGAALADFHPGGPLGTLDTRLKLVVPDVKGQHPRTEIDVSDPGWYRRWLAFDPSIRGHLRTYTARRFVAAPVPRLEVDFVLHLDADGRGGPAGEWAAQAHPGDLLTLLGPNRHHPDPGGYEWRPPRPAAGSRQRVLLVGDETALPAIAGILETLPAEYDGEAIVEVPCTEDVQQLAAPPGVMVTYLPRHGRRRGEATLEALGVRQLAPAGGDPATDLDDPSDDLLWETPSTDGGAAGVYAWVAGEASVVRDVRRALVGPHGVPRSQVAFMGYWRQGRAEG